MSIEFLFAGALGALIPFVLGVVWNQIQDSQRRKREKMGLLKLVHVEIVNNDLVIDRMISNASRALSSGSYASTMFEEGNALSTTAWESSRARLADLLEDRYLEYLASYYGLTQAVKNMAFADEFDLDEWHTQLQQLKNNLSVLAKEICRIETGRFRGWSNNMPVSTRSTEPSQLPSGDE